MLTVLQALHDAGVKLSVEAGRLVAKAATGVLDERLRALIGANKQRLIDYLQESGDAPLEAIAVVDRAGPQAASYAQQRLWFLDRYEAGGAQYNLAQALRLVGPGVSAQLLQQVLLQLVQRHETLRTVFAPDADGQPCQVILQAQLPEVGYEDLSGLPPEQGQVRAQELARQAAQAPFDLARGPLLRVKLLRLAAQEHLLVLTLHHIVSDGWSMGVLVGEVAQLYEAQLHGTPARLAPLPVQYADYAAWQRERLQGERLQRLQQYWQQQLEGAPALLELPTDRPRPALQGHSGSSCSFTLPEDLAQQLHKLAQANGATLFMVLQAAFALLLHRYSGQRDICVGTPVAGRERAELEGLIGFFVNTLVLRTRIEPQASFEQLLGQAKETALGAYAHQELPFEQLVEHLRPQRSLSYAPLFQVMFVLQNAPHQKLELPGLSLQTVGMPATTAKFDLLCSLTEQQDGVAGTLEYNTDLFDRATVQRFAEHYEVLLRGICEQPAAPVKQLAVLSGREQRRILLEWNDTAAPYPREQSLHRLFEQQARRTPEAVALVFEDTQLTYAELNARANRLAHHLRDLGVGPDVLVAVCAERSVEMVVALLATLKACGAYVPLDPSYPSERLGFMLADARPRVLLTQQALFGSLPVPQGLATFCLDSQWDALLECDNNPPCATLSAHLAYVIYTSGSTGKPKGVGVTHASVGNFLHSMAMAPGLDSEDVLLAVTSLSFDIAGLELWLPLIQGARCVLASREAAADGRQLRALIERRGVTLMQATPSSWRLLLEAGWPEQAALRVLCGGEALPSDLAAQLLQRTEQVWNLYGPTETTIWSALQCVRDARRITIGQPIANTQVHLLDDAFNLVPQGVPGELYIAGDGLARGYVNRPELTAERFVPNPFGVPGSRMYRTGDLARWLSDGSIDYLGRIDQQVKIRGFRIEPGEIEAVLASQAGVREAVVLAREDAPGDKRLVAYVVPSEVRASAQLGLSLFYFGADTYAEQDKYRLYLQAARFADDNGLQAIWTPERHFDPVGALYPNPAILNAALAASTRRVQLRAGSVVLPLQDPIRVAEEWAVVDNLSAGRIGLAIASGWHLRDFVLAPHQFEQRRQAMQDGIAQLQALWRGETIERTDGAGNTTSVRTYPRPLQPELPLWITAAGNPQTFAYAGQIGANVLTHLLGQTIEQVAANVDLYRKSLVEHGHDPLSRQVTLMVHTFMGEDQEATIEQARLPFMAYMRAHVGLQMPLLQSLGIPVEQATPEKIEMVVQFAFERYSRTAALIGTPESCAPLVAAIARAGVTEIACLIDWMDADSALDALEHLPRLREQAAIPALDAQALRSRCEQVLPHYMVPAHFVVLDALPLTPNGKIDRKALPAPQLQLAQSGYTAPSTPTEQTLARIWEQVLRLDKVGVQDHFFTLGGHSLMAVQLVSKIGTAFGVELPLRTLFEAPTVRQLAQRVEAAQQQGQQALSPPIGRVSREQPLALSFAQQRLWFIDQLEPGSSFYNTPTAVRLVGELNVDALHRTLNEVVRRHEVLRTSFQLVEGSPVQVIASELALQLPVTDLGALPEGEREAKAQWLAQDEAQTPFDLATGPLIRARLLRLEAQEHIVLLTLHHVASDAWSVGVLVGEIAALYAAFTQGQPSPLPELAIQYADFAAWQREWLSGAVLQQQLDYWRGQLQGAPELLTLPTDKPRPPMQRHRSAIHRFTVPADITQGLHALGRQEQATLFMTLAAAFQLLLARYSGQDDVCIGTPIANRQRAELEPMIGFFLNTLVLRTQVNAAASFGDLLRQVQATALGAYAHQDLPFEQLVDALAPTRSMAHQPLFQAMLVLQNAPMQRLRLPGLELRPFDAAGDTPKVDLSLSVQETGQQLSAALAYDTDLFDPTTIARMAGHFLRLLQTAVRAPEVPVHQLAWLAEEELAQLHEWNATETEYPREQMLHTPFEQQVARTPNAAALVFENSELTYAELNARANRLAHHLRELGVGPDVLVAVCAERSLQIVVALMAVLKAGGAYVPLDPSYPSERLAFMLADARPAVLLTQEALLASLPAHKVPTFCLDSQWDSLPARDSNPRCTTLPAHLAYVIYTSGSTGRPKAAGISHTAIVNRLHWMQQAYGLLPSDRVLQKTPFSFDVSVWEFFWPLQQGATLVLACPGGHQDAQYLGELIASAGITTLHFVPPMLEAFLAASRTQSLPALRQVMCSGQALPWELQQRFFERLPQVQLHNLYGPTEAAVDVTAWHCTPEGPQGVVPIGRPIFNIRIHIVDAQFNLLPQGVPGELCIAGVGLARSYVNRPDLTAERFVPDPFGQPGERMYRTGDLARWLPDGSIEYLGRIDQQVKIRGFRIELGEIETQLAAQAGVREAVVLAREDIPGDTRLVAYVVPQADSELEATTLRTQLQRQLPEYMVPAHFVVLEALPLTPNGKLDRKALPAPELTASRQYVAPRTPAEAALASLWAEVLHVEQVGIHDNFFELGGHSLLIVRLVEHARQHGLQLEVRSVYLAPTVAALAAALTEDDAAPQPAVPGNAIPPGCEAITPEMLPLVRLTQAEIDSIAAHVPGGTANIQDIYPLAPLQHGILFHHLLQAEGDAYIMRAVLSFDGDARLRRFLDALQAVIARHDALRSGMHWDGLPQPVQVVHRNAALAVHELDLGGDALATLLRRTDPRRIRLDMQRAPLVTAYAGTDPRSGARLLALLDHHIVSDNYTLQLVLAEVRTLLEGRAADLPACLPYRNFVARMRDFDPARHEAYFRAQLADVHEPSAAFGITDVHQDGLRLTQASLALPAPLAGRLRSAARAHGVPAAALFHLAWARVLARCCGSEDVVFGTVLSGRTHGAAGADRMLGLFINTLPLRVRLRDVTVRQAVADTHASLGELLLHDQATLALAQQCSGVAAPLPLFTTLLNYRHANFVFDQGLAAQAGGAAANSPGNAWEGVRLLATDEWTNYPVKIAVDDRGSGFDIHAQCASGIDAPTLARCIAHVLTQLADALEGGGDVSVVGIEVASADDFARLRHRDGTVAASAYQLLQQLREPPPEARVIASVLEQFHARVLEAGKRPAIRCGEVELSYETLQAQANQLAHALRAQGAVAGSVVCILLQDPVRQVAATLGVLTAGCVFCALDAGQPAARLAALMRTVGTTHLVSQSSCQPVLAQLGAPGGEAQPRVLLIDGAEVQAADTRHALVHRAPDDACYVFFTSGSTGQPKAVLGRTNGLAHFIRWEIEEFGIDAASRISQLTPPGFDVYLRDVFAALCAGATLCIPPSREVFTAHGLAAWLEEAGVSLVHCVPSVFRLLQEAPLHAGRLPALRHVLLAGEALSPLDANRWIEVFGARARLVNLYGPTETTLAKFFHRLPAQPVDTLYVPVGRPIEGAQAFLLREDLQPCAPGEVGEVFIRTPYRSLGYHGDAALTREVFIPNPFRADPQDLLYRTGDFALVLDDGNLRFMGRRDAQVKIRGMRVEPGEVEAVLRRQPGVRQCVVLAREDAAGDKRLVAYVVGAPGEALQAARLSEQLGRILPDYMVPAHVVQLDALPLGANGKVDRRALPQPDMEAAQALHVPPRTPMETALAALWAELLKLERVGIHDNFFHRGGHSLLAMQLVSRIRAHLRVELPLRALFEAPTLGQLALRLEAGGREPDAAAAPALVRVARDRPLALSFAQQRLWFIDQLEPGNALYNIPAAVRLAGELDVQALAAALDEVVRRHEVLRTSFRTVDGAPVQVVAPPHGLPLPLTDLSQLPDNEREAEAQRLAHDEAQAPFDLTQGPLIRARLLRLRSTEHIALLTLHHIASDAWSTGVLVREIAALYTAFARREASPLPELPIQYADYAHWQREWLRGDVLQRQLDHWREQLQGAPEVLALPTDRARPPVQRFRGAAHRFIVPADIVQGLHGLGRQAQATLFMTLAAAFNVLLSRYTGQGDICIGTPVANRQRAELEPMIGFFVNTLVLRTQVDAKASFATLLRQVRAAALGAYAHQDLPFEQLVDALAPARSMAHHPLFQVLLVLHNTPMDRIALPGLSLQPVAAGRSSAKFDLSLAVMEVGPQLAATLEYDTDLFDAGTIARMASHFVRLLQSVAQAPEAPVHQLAWLAEDELARLQRWNATEVEYAREQVLHATFKAQAARTPDAVALLFEDEQLTYAELNARANRLAHHLRELGVGPDVLVAVCVERSISMVVALMAVLKAGGAYVPLDPAYPAERIAFMLEDARPAVLLTQEALLASLPVHEVPTFCLDSQWDSLPARDANPVCATLPAHLAYVIYTSGSTGRPKGVGIQQRNACAFLAWSASVFDPDALAMTLASTSICFDLSVFEIFAPLACGASVCIVPNALALASGSFAHRVTLVNTVPSAMAALLRADALPASVRTINLAGEPLSPQLVQQVYQQPQVLQLFNLYGPTEDTTYSTWALVPSDEGAAVTIGRPIANSQVHILDESFNLVPQGVPGELCLAGDGLARGYIGRPELTADRFVPNPHGKPGERMYRTGDLARWLADGSIEYLGRIDQQVKIRGFRIEPGEIEAVLAAQAGVREAVVLAREDSPGDKRLVAYVVPQAGSELQAAGLRAQLQRQLPDYMVPAHLMVLDALPLTPNGKTDRKALPAPEPVRGGQGYVAPRTPAEATMAAAWSDVLGIDRVGIHDNFFELGGHSLLIIKLVERLRGHGLQIDVRSVFAARTLEALARLAQRASPTAAAARNLIPVDCTAIRPDMLPLVQLSQQDIDRIVDQIPGGAANVQDIYPLAPLQEGILFHHLLEAAGDTYVLRMVLSFEDTAPLERFLDALRILIDCHDVLRTSVHWDGLPRAVQVVHRQAGLPVHELALADGRDAMSQLLDATDPGRLRMALNRAPLIAAHVTSAASTPTGQRLLALLAHHVVIDHVTLEVCLAQVQDLLDGRAPPRPSQPYRNFVAAASEIPPEGHEAYFQRQLADVDAPCAPFGLLDVHSSGAGLQTSAMALAPAMARRIRETARGLGVSPAVLFHAAWAQVVARCSGSEDVVFGTVLSGRQGLQDAGEMLGLFINTLPLRLPLAGRSARGVVLDAHQRLGELMLHEQASLALAQRCSGVAPEMPLFTSVLNYRHTNNRPRGGAAGGSAGMRLLRIEEQTNYPIVLNVSDFGEDFTLVAQSAGQVDAARLAASTHQALQGLLDALDGVADVEMRRIDVLPQEERTRLLQEFNATRSEFPRGQVLSQLFEAQAGRTPGAVALAFGDAELAYAELNARANRLAHRLRDLGVGPDVLVAVCAERGVEMVVALLATLKAGGAYVPLDPSYPSERLGFMLADAKPAVLLTQQALLASLPVSEGLATFCLDSQWDSLPAREANLPRTTLSAHLAYVIYTSGSTGRPKGVGVTHASVGNFLHSMARAPGLSCEDVLLAVTSLSFDIAGLELWLPLTHGARCVLASREAAADGRQLRRLIERCGVTVMQATPSSWRLLLEAGWPEQAGLRVLCGGEALPRDLAAQLLQHTGQVWNLYGPTETTIWSALQRVQDARHIAIGQPIANTQVHILDEAFDLVPQGVPGELYIAGDGLTRGYLGRPELTAERFVPNPYGEPGARMYRTGDLARWLDDGSLDYLGRIDQQVKIRGFRIEPGEIEAVLARQPDVRQAMVLAREDVPGDRRLVAYVVPRDGIQLEPAALRAQLQQRLPDYMVPAHFMVLDALPLTPNGKLDRKALPMPDAGRGNAGYVAPGTPTEATLAAIWAEVLRLDRVGVQDNFFALGGHSLIATQLVSRVRAALAVELPLRALFEAPTIEQLARRVQAARQAALPAIERVDRAQPLALSFAQQRLWFIDQLEPASSFYNIPAAVRLLGPLDADALRRTLDAVVARHEVLRTTFHTVEGAPVQVIAPQLVLELPLADLSDLPASEREAKAQWLAQDEAQTPFDLATGPLIRAHLLRLQPAEHIALLTVHHIVSDGWSTGLLVREIAALYAAFVKDQPSPLPELAIQYADFAHWQRQSLSGDVLQQQLGYWRGQLLGAPEVLALPTDKPRPPVQRFRGATCRFTVPEKIVQGLHQVSRQEQATLFMTLAAAFNVLLARYSGQGDICIGTPIASRQRTELEPMIGLFVNTLVLRTQVDNGASFAELLRQVRATALGAYAHQGLPFEQLVDALAPTRSMAHQPLFQVMLTLQNAPMERLSLPGLELRPLAGSGSTAKFDLSLFVTEADSQLFASLEYDTDLFDATTIERMAGHFTRLLQSVGQAPASPVHALRWLAEDELAALREWNATGSDYAREQALHQLFDAQVERTPDAVALVFEDIQLTYAQLSARANRLAHHLKDLGVGPDVLVAVCIERGVEMVVALLAALKAGGAYVPLDPSYPGERLGFMLADAEPAVLLTQQALLASLPVSEGLATFCLDSQWDLLPARDANLPCTTLPAHLAYVIYTSGSTGRPKGVGVTHGSVGNFLHSMAQVPGLSSKDVLLAVTSLSFDIAGLELWLPLTEGARCVLASREAAADGRQLRRLVERCGVTVMQATPSSWRLLLEAGWPEQAALRALCGGEALPGDLAAQLLRHTEQVWNLYGPTETTIWSALQRVQNAERITIGQPIANTQVHILDENFHLVPQGVPGELYIAGDGLARGYVNRPELTAERFVPNPYGPSGSRMYRTGDLARWLSDGSLEYLGRIDQQVKIRGFRIELGEIEAVLAAQAGVREAVVLAREDVPGDKRLVAYVVPQAGITIEAGGLRTQLQSLLPEYMVPGHFVVLEALPLTPNGKLDRRSLPAPDLRGSEAGYIVPATPTEAAVASIWAEVLRLERVGVQDNFFALGGHSLLATQVLAKLRAALRVELPLRALFEAPTVAQLALRVNSARQAVGGEIEPVPREKPLALSYAQQRLWFIDQLEPGGTQYNMPVALRLRGALSVDALRGAFEALLARHEVLRTRFVVPAGAREAVQEIAPVQPFDLEVENASEEEVPWHAREHAVQPFDLARGPLLKARLLRLGAHEHVLLLNVHHIASDGWSHAVMTRDMQQLYAAQLGRVAELPALPVQYADYAAWQRAQDLSADLAYWKQALAGYEDSLELPYDHARPAGRAWTASVVRHRFDPALVQRLAQFAQGEHATLFMALLAALAVVLQRYSGRTDLCIGTTVAGRERAQLQDLIGFFINIVPLRLDLQNCDSARSLLRHVRSVSLDALEHQALPFEHLLNELQLTRDASRIALVPVVVRHQNFPAARMGDWADLQVTRLPGAPKRATSELDLMFFGDASALELQLEYATELFDHATIERMVHHLEAAIELLVSDIDEEQEAAASQG